MTAQHSTEEADERRFAFGSNWTSFLKQMNDRRIVEAEKSLVAMLGGMASLQGKRVLDIGSGSGLFSLAAARLGAASVHSFDYDEQSVACTAEMKRRFAPTGCEWAVERGDVLDRAYLERLGQWDIVYSWGVLHHTGRMWDAIANAAERVRAGGVLFISIYNDQGRATRFWTGVKRLYNRGAVARAAIVGSFIPYWAIRGVLLDLLRRRNPLRRYREYAATRGMSLVHDWVDWLGGYPFEAAKPEDIFNFVRDHGFALRNFTTCGGAAGCNEFVFQKTT
jgi:2-polyprenyl-6-hydroxyphenyl methylase/3-demethylubiquinone-9 3-methyltransferase